ncbi:MAG: ATP synthase subunit C [Treponema sp.]|jgi:V/A-type H+-transporting ATPase subunit K|nr:ATP synthase subunit C [Treponema sp.]
MKRVIIMLVLASLSTAPVLIFAQEAKSSGTPVSAEASAGGESAIWKYIAAALAVGISCIAGGIAVGQIGAAAMGAMSENPELSGKALPYAGLAEGICLWGFLVALLILVLN